MVYKCSKHDGLQHPHSGSHEHRDGAVAALQLACCRKPVKRTWNEVDRFKRSSSMTQPANDE